MNVLIIYAHHEPSSFTSAMKNVAVEVLGHQGHNVVVVVSAMGDTTDELLNLAKQVAANPDRRELDMLLSAGERISMALLAMAYGIVSQASIWYPINLLAAGFFEQAARVPTSEIAAFHLQPLLLASVIHLVTSLLVGVLYGATLPMMPRHPILLGGVVGPIVWTGLLYSILGVINPVMNARIDWGWFALSQVGFGLAAGGVVSRQARVKTAQPLPLAVRAGLHTPGLMREKDGEES